MMPLQRRRKRETTAMTTLNSVVLDRVSHGMPLKRIKGENEQSAPRQRCMVGFVVGIGIDLRVRIAVPAVIGAFLPESGTVEIRLSDAKEGESSDAEGQFEDEEADEDFGIAPLPWYRGE